MVVHTWPASRHDRPGVAVYGRANAGAPSTTAERSDRAVVGAATVGADRGGWALRRLGSSYGEIREVIPVPKATLAGWCRDIQLTDEKVGALKARTTSRRGVPRDTQRRRRVEVARIRADARQFAERHLGDPLLVAGTVLYWGEGAKTSPRLALSKADPDALRTFVRWVRTFHEPSPAFVLALHLHEGNDDEGSKRWWARVLDLADADFTKTYVKPAGTGHRKNTCDTASVASSCVAAPTPGTPP